MKNRNLLMFKFSGKEDYERVKHGQLWAKFWIQVFGLPFNHLTSVYAKSIAADLVE